MTGCEMKKILVVTGTRAEYGLLSLIMKEIEAAKLLQLQVIATGTHLSPEFGNTYRQITGDGFRIDRKVDMLVSSDNPAAIAKSMGLGMIGFAQAYDELKPDVLLVLGDRYEILAAVSAAIPFNITIAHIAGGEVTEGAMDEQIRHALTKMSHIHFACADLYTENIKKLGEEEWRVFNTGHPGIEKIKQLNLVPREELAKKFNLDPGKKIFLVTLHPTTLNSKETEETNSKIFFDVLKTYTDVNIVITYPNSDTNSRIIIEQLEKLKKTENIKIVENLGSLNYLSLMKESALVLGNSSSSIVEAPFFKIPVIDYGDRQKGRLMAKNIIHANPDEKELKQAIDKALTDEKFKETVRASESLYGSGDTSKEIVRVLENLTIDSKILRKKLDLKT
jgi:GDP/UDP-N,N'-diacetylbacillosamine 2-epimerase (hydrolysing)